MSSWLSHENFLYSRSASWCRRALVLVGVGGVWGDYYSMHYYHAFDPSEGRPFVVDTSPIGRTRCQMLLIPNNYFTNYSPWTPRNGDVVVARQLEEHPTFIQLLNGRFLERQTCGVALVRPLEEVERERMEERVTKAKLGAFLLTDGAGADARSAVLGKLS